MDIRRMIVSGILSKTIKYFLRDEFDVNVAADSVNASSTTPMPGLRVVVDAESKLSIASGEGVISGGKAAPAFGDPGIWWTKSDGSGFTRFSGLAMGGVIRIGTVSGLILAGWDSDKTGSLIDGIYDLGMASFEPYDNDNYSLFTGPGAVVDTNYHFAVICRNPGTFIFLWGNGIDKPRLLWVGTGSTATTLYPAISNYSNSCYFDSVGVADATRFITGFNSNYGIAETHTVTPANPTVFSHKADSIIELTWTPASGETLSLSFRGVDTDNTWRLDCAQAAGTIKLYKRESGSDAEQDAGKTQTFTVGTPYRIIVRCDSVLIRTYVNGTCKHVVSDAYGQLAVVGKVEGFATGAHLAIWPLGSEGQYLELERIFNNFDGSNVLAFGDSKTGGSGDVSNGTGFVPYLLDSILSTTGKMWHERPQRLAGGGYTIALWRDAIDAQLLLSQYTGTPNYILWNLGANDVGALPLEAAWKADAQYIIDAFHARWPSAHIYFMRPWRRSYLTECNTVAGWYGDLVTSNSTFCHLGPDERVFLEGGDDGATYTGDGTHPNHAGYLLTAAQWKTILGL